jgi:peptide/nickel transport system permease protein
METSPQSSATESMAEAAPPVATPMQVFWKRLRRQRTAMTGATILVILYLMALFAGFIAPYHFERQDRDRLFHAPMGLRFHGGRPAVQIYEPAGSFKFKPIPGDTAPIRFFVRGDKYKLFGFIPTNLHLFGTDDPKKSPIYLLGTDQYGRDIFSRLLYGSQISLSIGLIGIIIRFSLGMIIGGISGYFGGRTDSVIMRFCELIMSIPALYLIMALRATFPPGLSSIQTYLLIIAILSLIGWASSARVIRGMALSIRERQFVLAARTLGQKRRVIILKHILPSTFSYVIVAATLSVPYYILGEVVLSFLGVGIQEPDASWGIMLNAAQNPEYLTNYPWLLAPGVAIFITVLAFNFLGDGLRDAVDTKSQ